MNELQRVRVPVIAGNWKMHKAPDEAEAYLRRFTAIVPRRDDRSILFFPPAVSLTTAVAATADRPDIGIGVQNIYWEPAGAFTGEISAPMAKRAGAAFTLIGHSERRHVFGETDEDVRRKVLAALDSGLVPVLCVGEKIEERRAGQADDVIIRQLQAAVEGLDAARISTILIAYEPVWAIGTGETATPDDAAAAHGVLRRLLRERIGDAADGVPILYGGSVKPGNAASLLAASDVDGLLVGGASLDPDDFAAIAGA